ncbi:SGNH/GDSL hydrolase family protein [Streptomyces griseomycini]|uniref:Lysophospholipase L1-like esterase n=1 Tax=Streptomyces griseomycini TaxID=66895 RepID=A0A7W7V9G4_9ACTN|nr:SGNH/GDSL hydrolase family protein [Streptomyces griseomycini]MBB4901905.1 lysophospholipase L1-like esterase [Streptomyces griseomycini]GGR41130.1 hydrolase [Streptomyces griseomycini]
MPSRMRTVLATAAAAAVFSSPAAAPAAFAATEEPLDYVALGDSFAAGPLVTPADPSNPLCLRSLANYPHVAAEELGAGLTDVSCTGATADHLGTSQHPGTRPQYEALSQDTDVVSITVGGNDTDLFTMALGCVNLLPEPLGVSCAARNTRGGVDTVKAAIDAWAPTFADVLDRIRQRAPHAQVFVVGYGNAVRPGGCFPTQPVWDVDADYLQGAVSHLDAALRRTSQRHGAVFVDTYGPGIGHDMCAAPADRYIEGFVPARDPAPLHPNAAGSEAIGRTLAAAVRSAAGTG